MTASLVLSLAFHRLSSLLHRFIDFFPALSAAPSSPFFSHPGKLKTQATMHCQ
jgi:hypothetical protein